MLLAVRAVLIISAKVAAGGMVLYAMRLEAIWH